MQAFNTLVCIFYDDFRIFLGMGSQCMRFTCFSASNKTDFAFTFVHCHNACVSHASLHRLSRLSRFPSYQVIMHASTRAIVSVKKAFSFLVWLQSTRVSHVSLHRIRRLLRFLWYCVSNAYLHRLRLLLRFPLYYVTIYEFQTRVCIG